jgi:hypothetical protein
MFLKCKKKISRFFDVSKAVQAIPNTVTLSKCENLEED